MNQAGCSARALPCSLEMFHAAIIVLGYVVFSTRVLRLMTSDPSDTDPFGDKVAFFFFYSIVAILMASQPQRLLASLRIVPDLVALHLLGIASLVWSVAPGATLSRLTALIGTSLFGVYLARFHTGTSVLRLLPVGALATSIISFGLIFLAPSIGIAQGGPWAGTWVGAYEEKNTMGGMAGLSALICVVALRAQRHGRSIPLLGFVLNFILLAFSNSLTAQITFAACLIVALAPREIIRGFLRFLPIVIILLVPAILMLVSVVSSADLSQLLESLGKDEALSGRLPLWENVLPFLRANFWFGSGYEAFWTKQNLPVRIIELRLHFRPYYSHNGLIELWLGLGFVGLVAFFVVFCKYVANLFRLLYIFPNDGVLILGLLLLVTFCVANFSESVILSRNSLLWVLFVMLHIRLAAGIQSLSPKMAVATKPTPVVAAGPTRMT